MNRQSSMFKLVLFSLLLGIEALVCFTVLGSIPFTPVIVATLSHIPVILTAVIFGTYGTSEGVKYGAAMGSFFGLFSFLVWSFAPPSPIAFVFTPVYVIGAYQGNFWSVVICFVPRILIGVVAGFVFRGLTRLKVPQVASLAITGVIGSMTNTALVIGGIYLFFKDQFSAVAEVPVDKILSSIIGVNGLIEAALAGFVAAAVGKAVIVLMRRKKQV